MFNMNILGNIEPLSISVCKPDGSILGCIDNIINEKTASLAIGINEQYTLSFTVTKKEDDDNNWYEYLHEGMYLFVDTIGQFKLVQPKIEIDGTKESKTITAYSCDSELEDKTCSLSINMGASSSMEYLVEYEENEDEELLNPYTGIPYDWILLYNTLPQQLSSFKSLFDNHHFGVPDTKGEIKVTNINLINELTSIFDLVPRLKNKVKYVNNDSVLTEYVITKYNNDDIISYTLLSNFSDRISDLIVYYTKYRKQLSLLDIVLENTGCAWTVGDISGLSSNDYSLANSKYQFEINESIYSFLTQTLAKTINCVVNFDILNRKVNVKRVEEIGNDTGVIIDYDNLIKTLNISASEEKFATRLRVFGGDELGITRVNFGSNYIYDLSYKMNAVDKNGTRIYVSDELASKYDNYISYREQQRSNYINLSKSYEDYNDKISEIKYRVPNNNLHIDWSTYTQEELSESLKQFKNQLAALKSLYKNDYYANGVNNDGSINETFMRTTMYWYDYKALNVIIEQVECAIAVFPNYSDQTFWTSTQKAMYSDAIKEWETEWTLYGSNELKAKIDTYKQNMDLLSESSVIRVAQSSYAIKTWNNLSDAEKSEFDNDPSGYKYSEYMEYYNNMVSAQNYLDTLLSQISAYETQRDNIQDQRKAIVKNVSLETYFTSDECKTIYRLFRDADYTNKNIITTSLDTISQKIDRMSELLDDAKEKVSETSRPQLTFTIDSDNLLAIPEFEPLWSSFIPGNYINVQYKDNTYVRVRLIGYTFNPLLTSASEFSITFSNYTQSKSYYRDWASLLNNNSGSSSDSYSSGNSSNGLIDDKITNTLLEKLLNSETFGTRVTDVILDTVDVNVLTARVAKFGGLANGTTIIDGKCIKTGYIIDYLYNGVNGGITNTSGSIINLETGLFNLGGGKIKFDGNALSVIGALTATTLSAGGKEYASHNHAGLFIDTFGNIYSGANNQTKIFSDGTFNLCNGNFIWDGSSLNISNKMLWNGGTDTLTVKGIIKAETGYIGGENGWTIAENKLYSGSYGVAGGMYLGSADLGQATIASKTRSDWRIAMGNKFGVASDGSLYATDAEIVGKIVANEGHIGGTSGWHIVTNKIYSGTVDGGVTEGDVTLSTIDFTRSINGTTRSGLRFAVGYKFGVKNDGSLFASDATIYGNIIADSLTVADTSKNVFEWIDEKTRVWYGSPDASYPAAEEGDYLVDSSTGCTYNYDGEYWLPLTDYASAIEDAVTDAVADVNVTIDNLSSELQTQIDGRIETWAQNTNPASSWTDNELSSHDGDLWYYTGISELTIGNTTILPSKTYQYNYSTRSWTVYNSPSKSLFDLADGKSTIYYGTTSGNYPDKKIGDYLVDNTTGKTYKWNGSTWDLATDYQTYTNNKITEVNTALQTLGTNLRNQIDAKIETWAQVDDPSSSWSESEKASHNGDLWYYTGATSITISDVRISPSRTYQYDSSTGKWSLFDTQGAVSLFDFADTKTTIYYGATNQQYNGVSIGDYLVDSSTGCTYRWNGNSWEEVTNYNSAISDAIDDLEETLQEQIDGKIETWAQIADPSTSWSGTNAAHDGDLWYYIGTTNITVGGVTILPSKTYKYNATSGKWNVYNSPSTSLFDLADGKSTIYYGSPSDTYANVKSGDYLVDSADGCTYKWTGSAWAKVTDYSTTISNAISTLSTELRSQIDGKIETWAQSTNPAASWSSADKASHNGDLWYYTGITNTTIDGVTILPTKTYKYNSSTDKWELSNSPTKSLFDFVDGKSTIYYGVPTATYSNVATGDYLVDSTDGCTYRWTGSSWSKVTDYTASISSAVSALETELREQIDGKIETWYQDTDPSSAWNTSALRQAHVGDLWYYTRDNSTKRYNGTTWVEQEASNAVFDAIDGKTTIYYGTTSDTFSNVSTGDYLVDSVSGKTFRWTGSAWDLLTDYKTYTDGKISEVNTALGNLESSLSGQIDGKIETWAQIADPSESWATADRAKHNGDLWYYTGSTSKTINNVTISPARTYQYNSNTNKWSLYDNQNAKSLFDFADSKTTIYYGTTSDTFSNVSTGDYLVDKTNGKTYKWTGVAWEDVLDYTTAINTAVNTLRTSLESQIDGKIETWAQAQNPASSWTQSELSSHNGDLWYYTGTNKNLKIDGVSISPAKTYQFNSSTGKWSLFDAANTESLFDFADSKSTIFYGSTSGTYTGVSIGDYLIDSNSKRTYKWNGSSWDDVINYAQEIQTAINSLNNTLTQQIDAKIETWACATDPSSTWSGTNASHDGDLWYYTGATPTTSAAATGSVTISPSQVYRFSNENSTWTVYDAPSKSLFDLADGKTTIFYGTNNDTFTGVSEGDYLVDQTNGCTYKRVNNSWSKLLDYKTYVTDQLSSLRGDLEGQLDELINMWAQNTNPAASWTTADEKAKHNGDFWYYTGGSTITVDEVSIVPSSTYKYNSTTDKWVLDSNASVSTLFDLADGKSTIFYGTTSGTYDNVKTGDYLVDKTKSMTYRWTGSSWESMTASSGLYGTTSSTASAADKVVSCSSAVSLYDGLIIKVKFTYGNTSNAPTLNVNNLGAKAIYVNGVVTSATNKLLWTTGADITFMYAGGHFTPIDSTRDYYASSSTASGVSTKVAACSGAVICRGTSVHVTFTNANTNSNSVFLSLNSNTEYGLQVYAGDSAYTSGGKFDWNAGDTVSFTFDGQYWRMGDTSALTTINSYMTFESSQGLMIADMRSGKLSISGVTSGIYNTLLKANCLQIRNGTTVLAEYGTGIKLYNPGTNSIAVNITSSGATFTGEIHATSLKLGTDNHDLDASDVGGLADVATSGSATDISGLANVATSGSATDITGLANVATSGNASDISGLAAVATSGNASDVTGLAAVATSGSASDVTGLAAVATSGSASDISGLATVATTGSYNSLTNKPTIPTSVSQLSGSGNILYRGDVSVSNSTDSSTGITTTSISFVDSNGTTQSYSTKTSSDGKYILINKPVGSPNTTNGTGTIISTNGLLTARNAIIYGTIYASSGEFTGEVNATSGKIGGWTINSTSISNTNSNGYYVFFNNGSGSNQDVLVIRHGSSSSTYTYPFYLRADGTCGMTKATITGTVHAKSIDVDTTISMYSSAWSSNMNALSVSSYSSSSCLNVGSGFSYVRFPNGLSLASGKYITMSNSSVSSYLCASGSTLYDLYLEGFIRIFDGVWRMYHEDTGDYRYIFGPSKNNQGLSASNGGTSWLGSAGYRWHTLYVKDGAYTGSDKKIKDHIENLVDDENLETFIDELKPVMYTLKDGEGKRHHMGLYAQDVSKTAHETIGDIAAYQAAVYNEDNISNEAYYDETVDDEQLMWTMNYSEFIAPIIAIIQKDRKRIKELELRIGELEKE